jgi:hypothetical protein
VSNRASIGCMVAARDALPLREELGPPTQHVQPMQQSNERRDLSFLLTQAQHREHSA